MNEGMKAQMRAKTKDLDDELKNALRREEPPDGFAERVLGRLAEPLQAEHRATTLVSVRTLPWESGALHSKRPARHFVQWAAAAALVAAVAGGIQYRTAQKERAEGEAARARVMLALHIAGSKLQLVQTKINRMHEQPEKNSIQ